MGNFSTRKTLFGSKKHKLKASLHTEQSSRRNFIFTIDFLDACRSAKINEQTVKPWSPIYRAHKETVAVAKHQAFTDTVDQRSTYSKGICGEKVFALDPETTPKFISAVKTNQSDLINSEIEIRYDPTLASHIDVTVTFEITSPSLSRSTTRSSQIRSRAHSASKFYVHQKCPWKIAF